jgi:hypothetical protein
MSRLVPRALPFHLSERPRCVRVSPSAPVQTVGYGVEDAYHADNEFARLSDFKDGFAVLMGMIAELHDHAAAANTKAKAK